LVASSANRFSAARARRFHSPLLINGKQKFTQSHVPEEIPLMKVRKIMDEQLHVTGPLGQNQAGL
jgi:hypothetical protein